jgi:hypothetical protein
MLMRFSWLVFGFSSLSSTLIIISSFSVVSPLKFCVTAVKLAASLCCPIRQLVTRARAKHPRLSRGRPYRTCLPPGKPSADAKDETLTRSNPTSPKDGFWDVGGLLRVARAFLPGRLVIS